MMTPLQSEAWNAPFLDGTEGPPAASMEASRHWWLALSINK